MTREEQIRAEAETLRNDPNFGPSVADEYLKYFKFSTAVSESTEPEGRAGTEVDRDMSDEYENAITAQSGRKCRGKHCD